MQAPTRRRRLVETLAARGIADPRVLHAVSDVPRERFVEEALEGGAYAQAALPIGGRQSLSQPWIVARMTELLEPDPRARVLEIGTGSGYQAAILSRLFEIVYTVERLPALAESARVRLRRLTIENVHFKVFDGGFGWAEFAPYTAILVTAAVPEVPAPLVEQLADGGRLVAPVTGGRTHRGPQRMLRLRRRGAEIVREEHEACRFVPLLGRYGFAEER